MKKLNALVSAISLGLTLGFAALPVASAHSTLHVGNAHAKNMHQKYDDPRKYAHYDKYEKAYEHYKRQHANHANQPDFSKLFESCERITPLDLAPTAGTINATTSATAQAVASFQVPRYCDNSIAVTIDASFLGGFAGTTLTCQIYDESGMAIGSPSTVSIPGIAGFVALPLITAEIARTFPTFLPGVYGGSYGSGTSYSATGTSYSATGTSYPGFSPFLQTETKTVRCFASTAGVITVTSIDGQVDSQPPSQFVVYSLPHASYSNYAEGGYGYYAKHIKHVIKH